MDIHILNGILEVKEPPGIDTFDPRFTEITALIHQSEYKAAAERSQEALSDHLFDIRLISYFLYCEAGYKIQRNKQVGAGGESAAKKSRCRQYRCDGKKQCRS